jgi:hypothetical protein
MREEGWRDRKGKGRYWYGNQKRQWRV